MKANMSTESINKPMWDDYLRFLSHMPLKSDPALSVLKGHLLLEELLWQLIASKVRFPSELESVRFSFEHALALAKAVAGDTSSPWVWQALKLLNTVRNKLSHRLEPKDIDSNLRDFYLLVKQNMKADGGEVVNIVGPLHWHIGLLYIALSSALRIKPKTLLTMSQEERDVLLKRLEVKD
jgi:hypothetical protein